MAPERRVSSGLVPSRRIPVLVGTLPIEDGQTPPPVVGELGRFPLIFSEARLGADDASDATVSTWRVRAEPGNDGKPRGPGRRWDGTGALHDRPPFWPTTLHGDGWTANWPAPRPVTGQVELRGTLIGDLGISSRQWVRGRVTRARVVAETIDTSDPDQQQWRAIPARQRLREVEIAPRWFDHGLVAPPDAPATGWYSPVPGNPYVVETGVLVELDIDDVPPLPLRPAIVPAAVAAHEQDLWVADAALPLVVRLRGADPRPGAAAPQVHRYTWPGRILTDPYTSRRVHADPDGCWITGPDGVARADLDEGSVRHIDERTVTRALASAGTLLVAQLPVGAGPTAESLAWRLFLPDRDPIEVTLPAGQELRAVAADGTGSFVLLLLLHHPAADPDGASGDAAQADGHGPMRLARLNLTGTTARSETNAPRTGADQLGDDRLGDGQLGLAQLSNAQLVDGPPVMLNIQVAVPQWRHLRPLGADLEIGAARPVMLDAHQIFAAGGRVFTLSNTPDAGRRPDELTQPENWWPLPGAFTHPENERYDLLTELDPRTGEPVDTTLVARPGHLAVDGSGTVWLPGHTSLYSCPPGPGTIAEPFDVAALLDGQEPM